MCFYNNFNIYFRYIDAQNGFIYPDSFYEPPKAESPPASPNGNSGTSPSDESYEDALMGKPTTSTNNLDVRFVRYLSKFSAI